MCSCIIVLVPRWVVVARPHARGCAAAGRLGDVVFGSYPGSKLLFMVVVVRARPRQPPPRAFECAARSKLRSAANRASGRDRDSSKRARSDEHFGLLLSPAAREKSIGGGGGSKAKPRTAAFARGHHTHAFFLHRCFLVRRVNQLAITQCA